MFIFSCLRVDYDRATFEFGVAAFERAQRLICPQKSGDFFFCLKLLLFALALLLLLVLLLLVLVQLVMLESGVLLVVVHGVVHDGIARRKQKRRG